MKCILPTKLLIDKVSPCIKTNRIHSKKDLVINATSVLLIYGYRLETLSIIGSILANEIGNSWFKVCLSVFSVPMLLLKLDISRHQLLYDWARNPLPPIKVPLLPKIMLQKYEKIYVGIINNKNYLRIDKIAGLHKNNYTFVLLSQMHYDDFTAGELQDFIHLTNIAAFIPRINDYKFAKSLKTDKQRLFFMDWVINKIPYLEFTIPSNMRFVITNNPILPEYTSMKESQIKSIDWHHNYDGRFGYAISQHDSPNKNMFYKYSASLAPNNDLLFYEINGIDMQTIINL